MNIKFSHPYSKLIKHDNEYCNRVKLIEVINIKLEDLSKQFIDYDTDGGLFNLPKKGDYMMLVFSKDICRQNIFTTLRRRTPEKEKYYRSLIGQWLEVEFV